MAADLAVKRLIAAARAILDVDALVDGSFLASDLRVALHNCEQEVKDVRCMDMHVVDQAIHVLSQQLEQMILSQKAFTDAYTYMSTECLITKKRVEQLLEVISGA